MEGDATRAQTHMADRAHVTISADAMKRKSAQGCRRMRNSRWVFTYRRWRMAVTISAVTYDQTVALTGPSIVPLRRMANVQSATSQLAPSTMANFTTGEARGKVKSYSRLRCSRYLNCCLSESFDSPRMRSAK